MECRTMNKALLLALALTVVGCAELEELVEQATSDFRLMDELVTKGGQTTFFLVCCFKGRV